MIIDQYYVDATIPGWGQQSSHGGSVPRQYYFGQIHHGLTATTHTAEQTLSIPTRSLLQLTCAYNATAPVDWAHSVTAGPSATPVYPEESTTDGSYRLPTAMGAPNASPDGAAYVSPAGTLWSKLRLKPDPSST